MYKGIFQNETVAIKVLHVHLLENEKSDFINEAKILKSLNHQNITKCLEYYHDNIPFIILEYVPNKR